MPNAIQTANAPVGVANQSVYTPKCIIDLVLEIWSEGIALDPFPGFGAPVSAMAEAVCKDGFAEQWANRTYVNPPFKRLKEAMAKAEATERRDLEILLLGPAQVHRDWFWRTQGQVIGWLRPIAFEGYTSVFPRPLCLHFYGGDEPGRQQVADILSRSDLTVQVTR